VPAVNLKRMDVEALMAFRAKVDTQLGARRVKLEEQLAQLGGVATPEGRGRGRPKRSGSLLRGRKVPPKYRGPGGETWAGRGARPRWLVAALTGGKKLDHFLIAKPARGRAKTRRKAKR
jgi:DNA-binding protein H-NS